MTPNKDLDVQLVRLVGLVDRLVGLRATLEAAEDGEAHVLLDEMRDAFVAIEGFAGDGVGAIRESLRSLGN